MVNAEDATVTYKQTYLLGRQDIVGVEARPPGKKKKTDKKVNAECVQQV